LRIGCDLGWRLSDASFASALLFDQVDQLRAKRDQDDQERAPRFGCGRAALCYLGRGFAGQAGLPGRGVSPPERRKRDGNDPCSESGKNTAESTRRP